MYLNQFFCTNSLCLYFLAKVNYLKAVNFIITVLSADPWPAFNVKALPASGVFACLDLLKIDPVITTEEIKEELCWRRRIHHAIYD
jgi:hypothetical protein